MPEVIEVKVKVSNDEQKYVKKFLCYDPINVSKEDVILAEMVEGAVKDFKGAVDDVDVTLKMTW